MKYYSIIKYTGINIGVYFINSMMSNILNSKYILQLIGFIIITILIDAINLHDEYNLLEIKYNNLQKIEIKLKEDFNEIKMKLDLVLSKFKNKKNYNINIDYKDINKPYDDLDRKIIFKSNSFTFKNKETII